MTSLKPGDGITLMRIFYLCGKILENTVLQKQRVVIQEGLFIFPRVTEVVDIDSTTWRSKMTVSMHLFRGNKIVQMKKSFSRVFKHLYWNSSTFKSLILLLSFSSTFKDFKHLYEPCNICCLTNRLVIKKCNLYPINTVPFSILETKYSHIITFESRILQKGVKYPLCN